ncbi:MAG: hypothetical protein FWC04_03495, partial [Chitinispirillia bacterium]|nr:hypothetical protein [Chitinispirillia bacterium]
PHLIEKQQLTTNTLIHYLKTALSQTKRFAAAQTPESRPVSIYTAQPTAAAAAADSAPPNFIIHTPKTKPPKGPAAYKRQYTRTAAQPKASAAAAFTLQHYSVRTNSAAVQRYNNSSALQHCRFTALQQYSFAALRFYLLTNSKPFIKIFKEAVDATS